MATIIEFRHASARDTFQQRRGEHTGTAEIVIFPGVRVEYWSEDSKAPVEAEDEADARAPGRDS